LLDFKKLRIIHYEYGHQQQVGKLWHIHGSETGGGSVNTARIIYQKLTASIIFGHYYSVWWLFFKGRITTPKTIFYIPYITRRTSLSIATLPNPITPYHTILNRIVPDLT